MFSHKVKACRLSHSMENDHRLLAKYKECIFPNFNDVPKETLQLIVEYLDVQDLPSAMILNKSWYYFTIEIEQVIWLKLVRKHHPHLESLTLHHSFTNEETREVINALLPLPSRNWRDQFKRRHFLLWHRDKIQETMEVPPAPSINSYLFQVDLFFINHQTEDNNCKILTLLIDPNHCENEILGFDDIELDLSQLKDEISALEYVGDIDIAVYVVQRDTGKQALLYRGSSDFLYDANLLGYDCNVIDQSYFPSACCSVDLHCKSCPCEMQCACQDPIIGMETNAFIQNPACNSCTCAIKWSCRCAFVVNIHMFSNIEDDMPLCKDDILAYFHRGLNYL